jgi:hypothetical protein
MQFWRINKTICVPKLVINAFKRPSYDTQWWNQTNWIEPKFKKYCVCDLKSTISDAKTQGSWLLKAFIYFYFFHIKIILPLVRFAIIQTYLFTHHNLKWIAHALFIWLFTSRFFFIILLFVWHLSIWQN